MFAAWSIQLLLVLVTLHYSNGQHLCSVFKPFRITPEDAKFEIGGPFPLHTEDCLHVRPDVVQELIAVQWAISQWNQRPENAQFKLAFSAFDTCSRGRESLTQTVAFLHESGFFNPHECQANNRTPIGLIMPTSQDGRLNGLKETVMGAQVPTITYSGSTAQALFDANVSTVFSTAPTIDHLMQATITLLKSMDSNLVSVIYSDLYVTKSTLEKQLSVLSSSGITCSKTIPITNTLSFDSNSTEIVIMIGSKEEVINYFLSSPYLSTSGLRKLYVVLSIMGETWNEEEIAQFLLPGSVSYKLMIIQQGGLFNGDEFRDYFLDVLRNNYQNYAILAAYMQQVYNCTLIGSSEMIDCEKVDISRMIRGFTKNRRVESAVLATYAYGAVAKYLASDPEGTCTTSGPRCTRKILSYLKDHVAYTFGDSDPRSYRGFVIKFGPDQTLNSLMMEGFFVTRDPNFQVHPTFNFTVGESNMIIDFEPLIWSDGKPIRVNCDQQRPECQQCHNHQQYIAATDSLWATSLSELYLMGVFSMRRGLGDRSIDDLRSISMPAAFAYVLENMPKKYPHLTIGLGGVLFDSHHDDLSTVETVVAASSNRCLVGNGPDGVRVGLTSRNIIALASGQSLSQCNLVKGLVEGRHDGERKFFLGWGQEHDPGAMNSYYNDQARALSSLLLRQGWNYISVLLSEHDDDSFLAYESFRQFIELEGRICIADVVHVKSGERLELIRNANAQTPKIVLSFTTPQDTILSLKTARSYRKHNSDGPFYILVGDAHSWEDAAKDQSGAHTWKALALGALSVQSRDTVDEGFRKFLTNLNPKQYPRPWLISFWEDYFRCSMKHGENEQQKRQCKGDETLTLDATNGRMGKESRFMAAIENFLLAVDQYHKKVCQGQGGLCEAFFNDYENLTQLVAQMKKPDQFVIYNYRADANHVNGGAYTEIGSWTSSDGLKLNGTWTWYDEERNANNSVPESSCKPPQCQCNIRNDWTKKSLISSGDFDITDRAYDQQIDEIQMKSTDAEEPDTGPHLLSAATGGQWKKQVWAYVFLSINSVLLLGSGLVLTVVSVKLCCGLVKGNQSLGICLLFSVMLLYATAYFFIFDPCEILCRLRYIAHSISYSVCFGVMIAKAVQLRNSETVGFNGYISYWNYWLLLFFIVAVQIALNMQWALVRNPVVVPMVQDAGTTTSTVILRCSWTSGEFLASQAYVILLLCMALFMALLNRNVKRNYKETRWLMCTSLLCIGIWALWTVAYAATPDPFKDTVVVMELMLCATIVLCFMFGPKLYILLQFESVFGGGGDSPQPRSPTGPVFGDEDMKRKSIALSGEKDDVGIHYFDVDDLNEDGRRSALSGNSVKSSTTLCHTLSTASTSVSSDGSVSSAKIKTKIRRHGIETSSIDSPISNRSHKTIHEEIDSGISQHQPEQAT